jgi:heme/copper-type cytochrome/quinol oxidase subunit 4
MSASTTSRLRLTCALLTGVTLLSWWLGIRNGESSFSSDAVTSIAVLLIAALKVRVILWEFMELRHAPAALQRIADIFLTALIAVLLGLHAYGLRSSG